MSEEEQFNYDLEDDLDEKGSVAGLVFLTLLIFALVGITVAMPFVGKEDPELISKVIPAEKFAQITGEFHPLILHLPIGIAFLVFSSEVFGWLSFGRFKPKTGLALFLGVITAVFACITGYVSMDLNGYQGEAWENHMWGGVIFAGVLGLAYLAKLWGARNDTHGPVYGILLIASMGAMGYGAHIGGEKIHGTDPVNDLLVELKLLPEEENEDEDKGEDQGKVIKAPEDRLAYADVVVPILEAKCLACHGEGKDQKKKGGLLMDSWEGLLEGGEEAAALVPGDVKESFMIEVLNLPKDDDYHMPPPKKDQMEAHEIELLEWWVGILPDGDKQPEDQTLKELNAPQNIIDAAAKLVTPEELAAAKAAEEAAKKQAEDEAAAKREAIEGALNALKQDELFKTSLMYVSQDSTNLEFTAVSLRKSLDDEGFKKLATIADSLTTVKIGSTSISEGALLSELPKMKNLIRLDLSDMEIGSGSLEAVAQLPNLEWLNLHNTKVTDEGLLKLKTLSKLEKVYLWNSQATPEGAEALKKEIPELEFFFGSN
ncbi:hypothetical protein OAF33_01790 [bacterium]|nr:hypothetical protein [bacterium]